MILLDTNVISEPLRPAPEPRVVQWIDAQALETLYLSAVTVAELRSCLALLPKGKRRAGLQQNVETRILPLFTGRILPFDLACTQSYADLIAKVRKSGQAIAAADAFIAAIASANGMTIATRDTTPFKTVAIPAINPLANLN